MFERLSMKKEHEKENLEQRIVRSYIWLLRAPENVDGQRISLLSRHGPYEVRLLEPLQMRRNDTIPFWIELYDRNRRATLDSYGGDEIHAAAAAAEAMISKAEELNQNSPQG
jgi:hypothetical protein